MTRKRSRFKSSTLLIIFVLGLILTGAHFASAALFETSQLTDNSFDDYYPRVDGDYVVWFGEDGNDQEIFLHTISSANTTQITSNSYDDKWPQVARKQVVWYGHDGNDYEIFAFDISTGDTTQLTDNSYDDINPQVDGDNVVWYGWDGNDWEVSLYNLYTGTATQITDNTYDDRRPEVSGDKIVWRAEGSPTYSVSMYDIPSTDTTSLAIGARHWAFPQIGGDHIVWGSVIDGYNAVSFYDISTETTTQITYDSHNYFPQMDGSNVVWDGLLPTGLEIFLYNFAESTTTRVTNDSLWDWYPQISGDNVVWLQYGNGVREVMLYQIESGETTALTSGSFAHEPRVDAGRVVWTAKEGIDWGIFLATINNTFAGAGVAPVSVDIEGDVSVTFTDVTSDGYTFSTESSTVSVPPGGFAVLGNQFDITTTAEYVAPVNVTLPYDENEVPGDESDLKMYHWDGSIWEDVTVSVDTTNNTITGESSSMSPFVFGNPTGVSANIDFDPDTLNLKSKGNYITAYIELEAGREVANINIGSLILNGSVPVELSPSEIGDHDNDGIADLMVKFDRSSLQAGLLPGDQVNLTLLGSLLTGEPLSAANTIRVIDKGKAHADENNASSVQF